MNCSFLVILAIGAFVHVEAYYRREHEGFETINPIDEEKNNPVPLEDVNINKNPKEVNRQIVAETVNEAIVNKLAAYSDSLRTIVVNGNEDFPIMDPLVLPSIGPFTSRKYKAPIEVTLYNVHIEGLRFFIVEQITMNTNDSILFCRVLIPWLHITGGFECSASKPPLTLEPLITFGNFSSMVVHLEAKVQINLGPIPVGLVGDGINLKRIALEMSARSRSVLLSDVNGSEKLEHVIKEYLENDAKNNFRDLLQEVNDIIVEKVTPIMNDVLNQLTVNYTLPPSV